MIQALTYVGYFLAIGGTTVVVVAMIGLYRVQRAPAYRPEYRLHNWWVTRSGYDPVTRHEFNRFCVELRQEMKCLGLCSSDIVEDEI